MKFADVIDTLSARARISHAAANRCMVTLADIVYTEISHNKPVQLRNIGWIIPHTWRRNKAYNIQTGAMIVPKPVRSLRLKASEKLLAKLKKVRIK